MTQKSNVLIADSACVNFEKMTVTETNVIAVFDLLGHFRTPSGVIQGYPSLPSGYWTQHTTPSITSDLDFNSIFEINCYVGSMNIFLITSSYHIGKS